MDRAVVLLGHSIAGLQGGVPHKYFKGRVDCKRRGGRGPSAYKVYVRKLIDLVELGWVGVALSWG